MVPVALEAGERVFMPGDPRIPTAKKLNSAVGRFSSGQTTQHAQQGGVIGQGFVPNYQQGVATIENLKDRDNKLNETLEKLMENVTERIESSWSELREMIGKNSDAIAGIAGWNPIVSLEATPIQVNVGLDGESVQEVSSIKQSQNNINSMMQQQDRASFNKFNTPPKV